MLIARFGDLGLVRKEWPLLKVAQGSDARFWPCPRFARVDPVSGLTRLVQYADDEPSQEVAVSAPRQIATGQFPRDGVWGAGAVEQFLTKELSSDPVENGA